MMAVARRGPIRGQTARGTRGALAGLALLVAVPVAVAQQLEPRALSPAPTGMNFVLFGATGITGDLVFEATIPVEDASADAVAFSLALGRTFDFLGMSGKVFAVLPWVEAHLEGLVSGEFRARDLSGPADAQVGMSFLFYGAPAMAPREFANYREGTVAGVSLFVGIPIGEYDETKRINIGTNRWSARASLGVSRTAGPWTFEGSIGGMVLGDNDDYLETSTLEQEPIGSAQVHASYEFRPRLWLAAGGTYYRGGRTTVDGVESQNLQSNTRVGATLSLPLRAGHALKVNASSGVSTRTGTDFDTFSVVWQKAWITRRAGT